MNGEKDKVIGFSPKAKSKFVVFVSEDADLESAKRFLKTKKPKAKLVINRTLNEFTPA